jgi:uncharacterized RDD family membrane protein YckC
VSAAGSRGAPGLEGRQVLHSPEQVALHLPLAGPTSRMLAYAIDLAAIFTVELVVFFLLLASAPLAEWFQRMVGEVQGELAAGGTPGESSALLTLLAGFLLLQFVIEWGYFLFFELAMGGRSLGKRTLGLRVLRDGGRPLGLRESLVRNALRVVDMLPANYLVGLVAMVVSPEGKRLGDIAAGTVVVRLDRVARPRELPEVEEASAFRFDHVHLARLGSTERALLRQTLRRLDEFEPEAAAQALELAVETLRARLGYGAVEPAERKAFLRALWRVSRER